MLGANVETVCVSSRRGNAVIAYLLAKAAARTRSYRLSCKYLSDAAHAPPASPAHNSPVPLPCAYPSQTATTTTSPAAHTPATSGTVQEPADLSLPPNNAHPASPTNPASAQVPPCPLPSPCPMSNPSFTWREYDSASIILSMDDAYSEVVHWRKNTFQVPFGNAGKGFVSELSRLYKAYADGSALEAIALKACAVMSILLLQRPFRSSKRKDHSACLARRMLNWKKGDIRNLLVEGRSLQSRLPKIQPLW